MQTGRAAPPLPGGSTVGLLARKGCNIGLPQEKIGFSPGLHFSGNFSSLFHPTTRGNLSNLTEVDTMTIPLSLDSLKDVTLFAHYLGNYNLLEFYNPVIIKKNQILIQKGKSLTPRLLENLQSRPAAELPSSFEFHLSPELRAQLKKKLSEKVFLNGDKLSLQIRKELIRLTGIDLDQLIDAVFENHELLLLFTRYSQQHQRVLIHLGEVAVFSAALTKYVIDKRNKTHDPATYIRAQKVAFIAGLLHDIGWIDEPYVSTYDLYLPEGDAHVDRGMDFIARNFPKMDPFIVGVVADHHRAEPVWRDTLGSLTNIRELIKEAVCFADNLLGEIYAALNPGQAEGNGGQLLEKAFFNIGQAIGEGFYHPEIAGVIHEINDRLKKVLRYAREVGRLEAECPYQVAVAYPAPKCTSVICGGKVFSCPQIDSSQKITIFRESGRAGQSRKRLAPGEYPKCKLAARLPAYPEPAGPTRSVAVPTPGPGAEKTPSLADNGR